MTLLSEYHPSKHRQMNQNIRSMMLTQTCMASTQNQNTVRALGSVLASWWIWDRGDRALESQ